MTSMGLPQNLRELGKESLGRRADVKQCYLELGKDRYTAALLMSYLRA